MLNCIAGAIMYCSSAGAIHIDGPLSYARSNYQTVNAWTYAVNAVPIQGPQPLILPIRRS